MNIWVIRESEECPFLHTENRLRRAGQVASILANRGNVVTWWSSTYNHNKLEFDFENQQACINVKNKRYVLLHTSLYYKKTISVMRALYSYQLGNEFRKESKVQQKPDIIYCAWPLIDLSYEAIRYGKEHSIPVVIDIRDFWPDIFVQPFPKIVQPFVNLGVKLLFGRKTSYVMKNATAVVGVIPKSLQFSESHGRTLSSLDHVVHLAFDNTPVEVEDDKHAQKLWESYGLDKEQCIVSFIGAITNRIGDFDTLIEAASKCSDPSVVFVFCGSGNYLEELKLRVQNLNNVILPGFCNRAELQVLQSISTFGLLAYRNTEDFIDSLPSKFGEYLSSGLIILTSLQGLSKTKVEENKCGVYYNNADSLNSTIKILKNDKAMISRMSENALTLFYSEFDASTVYKNFSIFLENLVDFHKKEPKR